MEGTAKAGVKEMRKTEKGNEEDIKDMTET